MKKFFAFSLTCMLAFGVPTLCVSASSLDSLVNSNQQQVVQTAPSSEATQSSTEASTAATTESTTTNSDNSTELSNGEYIKNLEGLTTVNMSSPGVSKVAGYIGRAANYIVQILSYFITAFMAVRIVLDLCYIVLPFTRGFLANGYMGNGQAGAAAADGGAMGQPGGQYGMGGMGGQYGMGGMGGSYGMGGQYGMGSRYGMNRGMGMGMGMAQQQQMQGANPVGHRIQWISNEALNAVAAVNNGGPDGIPANPLKAYAKQMVVYLVLTPVLLVVCVSGALAKLGFLIGNMISKALGNVGGMI